jgi:hypothetical protein
MKSSRTTRLGLAIALSAVVVATPVLASAADATTSQSVGRVAAAQLNPPVEPVRADGIDLAAWALDRYARAGLDLPEVEIRVHEGLAVCDGSFGLHTPGNAGSRIDICTDPQVDPHWIILHELGHAWAAANLSDSQREDVVEMRGLEAWNDPGARWNQRGTEHAAEILAWGVAETSRLPGRIADHDLGSVTEAFQVLTGTEPICDTNGAAQQAPPTDAGNRRGGPVA